MEKTIKKDEKIIASELAEAIASFSIERVANLLTEDEQFSILDKKGETAFTNKVNFLIWLQKCIEEYLSTNQECKKLNFVLDRCSYCRIGNPVIIFENGKFPVNMQEPWESEKCGLMLEFNGNLISGITFCYIFLTTENPFNYEKKCSRKVD